MKLVLVTHGGGTAFKVADVTAFVGNDQRALELAGIGGVDPEIGGQLHRAADAFGHIDKGAIREDGGVQPGEEIVAVGDHGTQVFLHQLRVIPDGFGNGAEDHAGFCQWFLERGGH